MSALVPTLFVSRCFSFELPFELKALYVSPRKLKQTLFGIQIKLPSVNPIESIISACLQNSYSSIENKRACKTGLKYYSKASGNFVSSIKSFKIKSLQSTLKQKLQTFMHAHNNLDRYKWKLLLEVLYALLIHWLWAVSLDAKS